MASLEQIRANQSNAHLSTGPRSAEGKAVVSRNALKSGIHAVAATALPFENLQDLEDLKKEHYERWTPGTPEERDLVDDLIRNRWLLRRFAAIEDQLMAENWDDRFKKNRPEFAIGYAYRALNETLARLHRRVTSTEKSYRETFLLLKKLRGEPLAPATHLPKASAIELPQPAPEAQASQVAAPNQPPAPPDAAPQQTSAAVQLLEPEPLAPAIDSKQSGQDLSHVRASANDRPLAIGFVPSTLTPPPPDPGPQSPDAPAL